MSNIVLRSISGLVFITIVIGSILLSGEFLNVCLEFFSIVALYEYAKLSNQREKVISIPFFMISGILIYFLFTTEYVFANKNLQFGVLLFILIVNWIAELWRNRADNFRAIGISTLGLIYCTLPFVAMYQIHFYNGNFGGIYVLLYCFILVWTNDTFAYLSGRFFGKHKLFERISPKKTWEGTIGGLIFTAAMVFVLNIFTPLDLVFWLVASQIIAVSAILGDLFESLLKRNAGIKDSGNLIPGHGGVLDRFDAMLFAAPIFLFLLTIYLEVL